MRGYIMTDLIKHIKGINKKSRQEMAEYPGTYIGLLAEDRAHWNDQGIYTVEQFEYQMDYYGLYDILADHTSKSYARMKLRNAKNMADLDAIWEEWKPRIEGDCA